MSIRRSWSVLLVAALACSMPFGAGAEELNGNEDFAPLARRGFAEAVDGSHTDGSPDNSYAFSMAWFQGRLFVGTIRNVVDAADQPLESLRAEIWRYTPAGPHGLSGSWQRVYRSPLLWFTDIPWEIGYRNMLVCDAGDGVSRLYVATLGTLSGRLLYTEDGESFQTASTQGFSGEDPGYRPLVCMNGWLFTSPVGISGDSEGSLNPVVMGTSDPLLGTWQQLSPPRFGNPDNGTIFTMEGFDTDGDDRNDTLVAGVGNRAAGMEVWVAHEPCQGVRGSCEVSWSKVLEAGGGRPVAEGELAANVGVSHMAQHGDYLYMGVAETALFDPTLAEVFRLRPDFTWDLVAGIPRDPAADLLNFNCNLNEAFGLCLPVGGRSVGMGDGPPFFAPGSASYVWRLQSHTDGYLYAGTLDLISYTGTGAPGFELWRTPDGESWSLVSDDGLGNPWNYGLRTMVSTDLGLFVGTANPFTEAATGGAEVWLGTCAASAPPRADAGGNRTIFDDEAYPEPGDLTNAVALDGSASADPFCGELVSYQWYTGSLDGGGCVDPDLSPLDAEGADGPVAQVELPTGPDFQEYLFALKVVDDEGNESCDEAVVRSSHNLDPAAAITSDPPAEPRSYSQIPRATLIDVDGDGVETVGLSAECSDPEGNLLSCRWSAEDGVVLDDASAATTSAVVPDVTGGLDVYLIAVDDHGYRDVDIVNVRVRAAVRDVAVVELDVPEPTLAGEEASVSVGVVNTGNTEETFEVTLADADGGTVSPASRAITLEPEGVADVAFSWTPSDAGRHRVAAAVGPLPDEANTEDNTLTREVDVTYDPDASLHVADLDATADGFLLILWQAGATASIEDSTGAPVQGAGVRMRWSTGLRRVEGECVTDALGQCSVSTGAVALGTVTFEVVGVSAPGWFYVALENDDPDGDSDGTTLTVQRPAISWRRLLELLRP
jgi:hypothetical protein